MEITIVSRDTPLWNEVKEFAAGCSWSAGKELTAEMESGEHFRDWERVIAATEIGKICGFCGVEKVDGFPGSPYTPNISSIFVDEKYRGHRISEKMIRFAMNYLKSAGFNKAYLVTTHENLYEKYGFHVIGHGIATWNEDVKIYEQDIE